MLQLKHLQRGLKAGHLLWGNVVYVLPGRLSKGETGGSVTLPYLSFI